MDEDLTSTGIGRVDDLDLRDVNGITWVGTIGEEENRPRLR